MDLRFLNKHEPVLITEVIGEADLAAILFGEHLLRNPFMCLSSDGSPSSHEPLCFFLPAHCAS